MDMNSGLVVLGTAVGSAQLVTKILGPTADYIGTGIQTWTEQRVQNLARIFHHAQRKLGPRLESEGTVSPRVLKNILDEGSFCNDELTAEYFGGVLASSKSDIHRDDRGASLTALIGRLTTYQIRTHFFLYSLVKVIFDGDLIDVGHPHGPSRLTTFVPTLSYNTAMEFSSDENSNLLVAHSLFGLNKEALIADFRTGSTSDLEGNYDTRIDSEGLVFQPSELGTELFLWAHGRGDLATAQFLSLETRLPSDCKIQFGSGFKRLFKRAA